MSTHATRSPYLRDRLLEAVKGLRKDAETARLNLAAADQDVAAARALLQEAEAQAARARAEVDSISRGIAWLEREAAHLAAGPDPDPAEQLRATGLMREEPIPAAELPGMWEEADFRGGATDMDDPRDRAATCAEMGCTSCLGCDDCACHDPDGDLPFNVVQAPQDVVAALTGGHPVATPPVPHEPAGQVVATHGPTATTPLDPGVTTPDAGLAHPGPNPPTPPAGPRHAARPADRPGLLARLTGGHRIVHDEQDGDA